MRNVEMTTNTIMRTRKNDLLDQHATYHITYEVHHTSYFLTLVSSHIFVINAHFCYFTQKNKYKVIQSHKVLFDGEK